MKWRLHYCAWSQSAEQYCALRHHTPMHNIGAVMVDTLLKDTPPECGNTHAKWLTVNSSHVEGVGKMRDWIRVNCESENAGICCRSTGKMREAIECGNSTTNRRSNDIRTFRSPVFLLLGIKVPSGNFRSQERKFPGTFAPGNECSRELSFPV